MSDDMDGPVMLPEGIDPHNLPDWLRSLLLMAARAGGGDIVLPESIDLAIAEAMREEAQTLREEAAESVARAVVFRAEGLQARADAEALLRELRGED